MNDRGYIIAVVVWPFIFLAPYTLNSIGIGNDFGYLYYVYKVYLLSVWNSGHFPLWSPTEGAGYPFFSNPFAQAFYPLNLLYFAYYKVWVRPFFLAAPIDCHCARGAGNRNDHSHQP